MPIARPNTLLRSALGSRPIMPRISAEIVIDAPAADVWRVLVDFDRYPEWNRFTPRISLATADLRPGAELDLDCQMSADELLRDEHEVILELDETRFALCMGTSRSRGRPGIVSERWQICEPLGLERTRFRNWEQFRGAIAPLVYLLYAAKLRQAFADYCAAIAARVADRQAAGRAGAHTGPGLEPEILPTREGYDRWAAIYDDEDNPLIGLEERFLPELLGELRGRRVVDLGCGTGRHALGAAHAGADVTAVDFSESMLAKARAKPGADRVRFVVHDLGQRLPFEDETFDLVLCCLVLEHIADLGGLFREMRRICHPAGHVVLTAMHPAMMLRGITARFADPATGRDTRPRSCANQISDYLMAATRAGLRLEHLGEHPVDAALCGRSARAARYLGWPLLLTMQLGRAGAR